MSPARDDLSHIHRPVMVSEVLGHLFDDEAPARSTLVVDGTVGLGGHALAVLERSAATRVLGLDRDAEALTLARERLAAHAARVRLVQASYAELAGVLSACEEEAPWGVLLDLGASSLQFDDPARGFSFRAPSPDVDMRFDRGSEGPTALELVNELPEAELSRIVHEYGEEPRARAVARAIVEARRSTDGARLVEVVRRAERSRRGALVPQRRGSPREECVPRRREGGAGRGPDEEAPATVGRGGAGEPEGEARKAAGLREVRRGAGAGAGERAEVMRALPVMAVVLAAVATALVGIRQQGEARRLERMVWEGMRRRDQLTKQLTELETSIEAILSPRRLLEARDLRTAEVAPR